MNIYIKRINLALLVLVTGLSLAVIAPFAPSAYAVTAVGGGCGTQLTYTKVGLKYKSCIYQNKYRKINIYEYMDYTSTSKSVKQAWVQIEGWTCSGTTSTSQCNRELRSKTEIDITYFVNKRPRPAYDIEKGLIFDANPGQILRSKSRLCVKMTSSSAKTCSTWAYSKYQIAGS